jgi:hypothetical protein
MSSAGPTLPPVRSLLVERRFPRARQRSAERDWIFFLLEELNGLGDVLRFRQEESGPDASIDEVVARVRAILEALGWQPGPALTHTWAFVKARLHFPEDGWGPNLVLERFEPDGERLAAWRAGLPSDARAILASTLSQWPSAREVP